MPVAIRIEPGLIAVSVGHLVEVLGITERGRCEIRNLATDEVSEVACASLKHPPSSKRPPQATPAAVLQASDEKLAVARRRARTVEALLGHDTDLRKHLALAAQKAGVTVRTVYRWIQRYREPQVPVALLSQTPGPKLGSRSLSPITEAIITETLEKRRLTDPRGRFEDLYREVVHGWAILCRASDRSRQIG